MTTNVVETGGPDLLAQFLAHRRGMKITECAAPAPSEDQFEFVMSDDSIDRYGDSLTQNWVLGYFKRNPIALFNHSANQIIGKWTNVRVEGNRLLGRLELAEADTSELVRTIRRLVEQKILRAVSVGFRALQKEKLNDKADDFFGPFRFLKSELLECSLVAVPANANAISTARSMNLSPDVLGKIFGKPAIEDLSRRRAITGKPAKSLVPKGAKIMLISQRIQAKQQRIVALRDKALELANLDDETITDDQRTESDEISGLIEAEEKDLARLMRLEKSIKPREESETSSSTALATTTVRQPITGEVVDPPRPFAMPKKKIEPADLWFRSMAIGMRAFAEQVPLEHAARQMYGNDTHREETFAVLRAVTAPAQTTVAGWAAELAVTANAGFLDRLIADSIYGPLSAMGARYDLGRNAQIKIPRRTTAFKASGAWIGEGLAKPVKRISLDSITISPNKLAVISTFTEEMAQYSIPAIEGLLRQAMIDDTQEQLDTFLIDNVAASVGVRPAGLLNGAGTVTPSAATPASAAMVADLKGLVNAIIAAGGGRSIAILINPKQALSIGLSQTTTGDFLFESTDAAGRKLTARFIVSRTVPADRVIALDAADFATVTGDAPRFAVSNEATLHEEDTTPLPLSATGTPNVVAAPMRSLFQTDSVAIRLSLFLSWTMRRTGMVHTVSPVIW